MPRVGADLSAAFNEHVVSPGSRELVDEDEQKAMDEAHKASRHSGVLTVGTPLHSAPTTFRTSPKSGASTTSAPPSAGTVASADAWGEVFHPGAPNTPAYFLVTHAGVPYYNPIG